MEITSAKSTPLYKTVHTYLSVEYVLRGVPLSQRLWLSKPLQFILFMNETRKKMFINKRKTEFKMFYAKLLSRCGCFSFTQSVQKKLLFIYTEICSKIVKNQNKRSILHVPETVWWWRYKLNTRRFSHRPFGHRSSRCARGRKGDLWNAHIINMRAITFVRNHIKKPENTDYVVMLSFVRLLFFSAYGCACAELFYNPPSAGS